MAPTAATDPMARTEKTEVAYQVRSSRAWLDRVQYAASQLEMSAAAYIRQAVTLKMNADGVPLVPPPEKKPPRRPRPRDG